MKTELKTLEKLYKKAVADGKTSFMFKGTEMWTDYVKYYLESKGIIIKKVKK